MENISFNDLISDIRADSILDVGCAGLGGENTTDFLVARWGAKVHGVCKDPSVQEYADKHGIRIDIKVFDPKEYAKYDLVCFDARIDDNLAWWRNMDTTNTGKYFATYIITTDDYGDKDTSEAIRETWDAVWGGFPTMGRILNKDYSPFKLKKVVTETRRPEITWVLLEL